MPAGPSGWANPLPAIVEEAYAEVYDRLGEPAPAAGPALARLMRLRALEGPDAAPALAFLSRLKTLLREGLGPLLDNPAALAALDARIEALAGESARHFAASRQLLVELRQREPRLRTAKLDERLQRRSASERTRP